MLAEHLLEHAAKRAAELLHQRAGSQNGFFKSLLLKRLHPVQNDRAAREKLCGINQNGIYGAHALDTFIAGDHRAAARRRWERRLTGRFTASMFITATHTQQEAVKAVMARDASFVMTSATTHRSSEEMRAHRRQNLRRGLCRVRLIGNL